MKNSELSRNLTFFVALTTVGVIAPASSRERKA